MVVPNTPTTTVAVAASNASFGARVRKATWDHGTCTVNRTAAYESSDRVSHFKNFT